MKFTILGASGVIGRALVSYLRSSGHDVYAPARGCDGIFRRDLGNVIYAIGLTADFRRKPFETVEAHVSYLKEVLELSKFDTLLYLSSTRVYKGLSEGKEEASICINPRDSSDLYNISKIMGEAVCLNSGREGVKVARLSNVVYGDDGDTDNFIPSLYREARNGSLKLMSPKESAKDYIHIDDVVEVLPKILIQGAEDIYNVASGIKIKNIEWIEKIASEFACKVLFEDSNVMSICFPDVNIDKLKKEFYFSPRSIL